MARIAGVDLPRNKRSFIALTYIYGIGQPRAARGNLHFYGSVLETYNGVSYPLPAWERTTYYVGGLRCARSGA